MASAVRPRTDAVQALRDRVSVALGDRYLLGETIGQGGTAVVFAAEEIRPHRDVALKVLREEAAVRHDVRARFLREAQTAARLNHPNIVPVLAAHDVDGLIVCVMGRVIGASLATRLLQEPRPPVSWVAMVLEHVADALAYAHAAGIVHRDIKPDNILLDHTSGRAMVTDFGIARVLDDQVRLTHTGMVMGTPAFMSPEQAMGDAPVDGRSDLYGLGVLGFLMLTGEVPFDAPSTAALLTKHVHEVPRPVRQVNPTVPAPLAALIDRCLAKRPDDRWPSALTLRDALRRMQRDGSLPAHMPSAAPPRTPALVPLQDATWSPGAAHGAVDAALSDASAFDRQALARFRRRLRRTAFVAGLLVIINWLMLPDVPWAVLPALWMVYRQWRAAAGWRARGLGWWDLFGDTQAPIPVTPPPTAPPLHRVPVAVRASAYAEAARSAVEDHLAVQHVAAQLSPADRAMVPDIAATADSLLERTLALAGVLADLDRALPDAPVADAELTIAASADAPAPTAAETQGDRIRALQAQRRGLQAQLARAGQALRTLRLDVLALRTQGLGGASDQLTRATQDARALSADIARALNVADEVRRL